MHAIYKRPHSHLKHSDVVLSRLAILSHPNFPDWQYRGQHTATGVASHPVSSRIGRCLCRTPSAPRSDNCLFSSCFWPWPTSDLARLSKGEDILLLCVGAAEASPFSPPPLRHLGRRAKYVSCSCEADYVLIHIASWGLLRLFRRAGESQPETCPPLAACKGVFLRQTSWTRD